MKTIQPVQIWKAGSLVEATLLNSYVVSDNLLDSATFYYSLLSESKQSLAEGNLSMSGTAYDNFTSNEYAYDWIASSLNVTITGEYQEQNTEI